MGLLGGKTVEEVVPIKGIDPVTCREKLKGDVDEHGNCLVKIRLSSDPTKATLEKIGYTSQARPAPAQPQPPSVPQPQP